TSTKRESGYRRNDTRTRSLTTPGPYILKTERLLRSRRPTREENLPANDMSIFHRATLPLSRPTSLACWLVLTERTTKMERRQRLSSIATTARPDHSYPITRTARQRKRVNTLPTSGTMNGRSTTNPD